MSLNRNEKQTVVTDVAAQVARSQTLALAEYRGLTVEHLERAAQAGARQGRLSSRAEEHARSSRRRGHAVRSGVGAMVGPLIYGFSEDAVAAAKVVSDFAKRNDKLIVKAGAYAGKVLDAEGRDSRSPRSRPRKCCCRSCSA